MPRDPRRGDVFDAALPEPAGLTPVVVLTRDVLIPYLGSVAVAPLTDRPRGVPTEVPVGPEAGVPEGTVVLGHAVATVPKEMLRRHRGVLGLAEREAVGEAVRRALDL